MARVPVFVLAGQSNAELAGVDHRLVSQLTQAGGAFEFVKVALGGTSLFANAGRDWDPASGGELFSDLLAQANDAAEHVRQQGQTPYLVLLWIQGEADLGRSTQAYVDKFTDFAHQFRSGTGDPSAAIYLSALPYESTVRTAQIRLAATLPDVHFIETVGAGTFDGAHYDRPTRDGIADHFLADSQITLPTLSGYRNGQVDPRYEQGASFDTVTGSQYLDFKYTYAGSRVIHLNSFSGDDDVTTGSGNDVIMTGGNNDLIHAGAGDDVIDGGDHDDTIYAGTGDDFILGRSGSDLIYGEEGRDYVVAGAQDDRIYGGAGDDIIEGSEGNDLIDGGAGIDAASYVNETSAVIVDLRISGAQATGGAGQDTLVSIEDLVGSGFDDVLTGDGAANQITGGGGSDRMTGGGGDDLFKFSHAQAAGDTITDFAKGDALYVTDSDYAGFRFTRIAGALKFDSGETVTLGNDPVGRFVTIAPEAGIGTRLQLANHYTALNDFNADGHSDILWRSADGTFTTWQVSGNIHGDALRPNAYINYSVSNDWRIKETLDFNGDGASDILWRNTNGAFTIWNAAPNGFTVNAYVDAVGVDWSIAAAGDFDGDGKDDLIWRNVGGAFSEWRSTGTAFSANVYFSTAVSPDWKIVGAADFDGDGKDDLLWRNANSGTFTEWRSNGTGFDINSYVDGSVDRSWHIAGTADFNGDGKDDLLWRNDDGRFTEWQSTGAGFKVNAYVDNSVSPEWKIVQIGDFNDDGRADLLFRNVANGAFSTWQSTGSGFEHNVVLDHSVSTAWTVQAHDYLFG